MSARRPPFYLRSPWRVPCAALILAGLMVLAYFVWQPGREVLDGRHDRARNALWLGHAWLGDDTWFTRNGQTARRSFFRDAATLRALAEKLRGHGVRDVFPHLCPSGADGSLPTVDEAQAVRFLDHFEDFRVLPWIGGVFDGSARIEDAAWRARFCREIAELLTRHPRFAGVQLNVEPCPSGNAAMLTLLEEIRAALPPGKLLSVAAYPPPTWWQPGLEVHWEEVYFRAVARRVDQLAVMMYDTSLPWKKPYVRLMADWTREVLAWSEGREVLLGVAAYDDAGTGWHDPEVENLATGLAGIHAGLSAGPPPNFAGVAIYSEWEMDAAEWDYFTRHFTSSAK